MSRWPYIKKCSDCGDTFFTSDNYRDTCDWCAHIRGPFHPPPALAHRNELDVSPGFENAERAIEDEPRRIEHVGPALAAVAGGNGEREK